MERLTYITENGEVLFHPEDLPDDEGMTITQLAEDGRLNALEEIAERLANHEQAEEQGMILRLRGKSISEEMRKGMSFAYQSVFEEICTIKTELQRKGIDEPKGFSTLEGFVADRIQELN